MLIVFSAFMAWWFFFPGDRFFMMRQAAMDSFFRILPIVFIFLVPAISMRLWSEEFADGTVETLLTLPVPTWKLVVGKFLPPGRFSSSACSPRCRSRSRSRLSETSTGGR